MINIKDFNPNLLKIDKKAYRNYIIYYIGYITMKDSKNVNITSVNLFYLIIGETDGSIGEKKWKQILADTDKNTEVLEKYIEFCNKTKFIIEKMNRKSGEYEKDYMKIKLN